MMTAVAAHHQLQRLIEGRLYLLSLPWDAAATDVQIEDARQSAAENQWNAVLVILVLGVVLSVTARSVCQPRHWQWNRPILLVFALSVLADLATTIWFFHGLGVEFEFHPAIRLCGYAYGQTIGPILGKTIQAVGVLYVAILLKNRGHWLLILVSTVYSAAAIYNAFSML